VVGWGILHYYSVNVVPCLTQLNTRGWQRMNVLQHLLKVEAWESGKQICAPEQH